MHVVWICEKRVKVIQDSFTTSITGCERWNSGLVGTDVWFSIVSISNGGILSTVSIDGLGLGWCCYSLLLLIELKNGSVSKSHELYFCICLYVLARPSSSSDTPRWSREKATLTFQFLELKYISNVIKQY